MRVHSRMLTADTNTSRHWHSAGLFLVTFATLLLEVLNTRLLSVLTWYHLSFLAVSLAMLGMAGGAVHVFLQDREFAPANVRARLATLTLVFAALIALSHLVMLFVQVPDFRALHAMPIAVFVGVISVLTAPFLASGLVVTLALTRAGGSIGRLYFFDLVGASVGCLAVIVLLGPLNITSVAFIAGGAAAGGALCFDRFAGRKLRRSGVALCAGLIVLAVSNGGGYGWLHVRYAKQRPLPRPEEVTEARWNSHSFVIAQKPRQAGYFYWGPGAGVDPAARVRLAMANIDGDAGTFITEWDGRIESLAWVEHDVTNAPYTIRRGDVGVIGVGGGRDILSAIRSGSTRITGIEINSTLLDVLNGSFRDFARIAGRPGVTLVHDEARSYLSRSSARFDVLQMSLIDTWAATGAGAFSLSENGLYTVEAWRVFLGALKPDGVFSVSRWFYPGRVSETTRLLALGAAALLDTGFGEPRQQMILVARNSVATLMCSRSPFTAADRERIQQLATKEGFTILASPWTQPATEQMAAALRARTRAAVDAAVADPDIDYTAPTDSRPFFFSLLKLRSFARTQHLDSGGLLGGNMTAATTLVVLFLTAATLVTAIVLAPLVVAGASARAIPAFGSALLYFALIGAGYMLVQVAFLQRFSVFLGHPMYTFAIILFSMILFTGLGSLYSERLDIERGGMRRYLVPLLIAITLVAQMFAIGPVCLALMPHGLLTRIAIVLAFTAPVSLLLGCCFPIGMRLVTRLSPGATAWMWGVNGACGVMASIGAVAISMTFGINANLLIAATLYSLLVLPMRRLVRRPLPIALAPQ